MALKSIVASLFSKGRVADTGDDNTQIVVLLIVAGVALFLLAATFAVFFVMRRRENKKASLEKTVSVSAEDADQPAEEAQDDQPEETPND